MANMRLNIPEEINFLLKKFALEYKHGSREKATIYILKEFLEKIYELEKKK